MKGRVEPQVAREEGGKERDEERAERREAAYTQEEADRSTELTRTTWRPASYTLLTVMMTYLFLVRPYDRD